MENANQLRKQSGEQKLNQKPDRGSKRNLAPNRPANKKLSDRRLSGEKLNKLFAHLAYQELDAD